MFNISASHWFYAIQTWFPPANSMQRQYVLWHRNIYHRQLAGMKSHVLWFGFVAFFFLSLLVYNLPTTSADKGNKAALIRHQLSIIVCVWANRFLELYERQGEMKRPMWRQIGRRANTKAKTWKKRRDKFSIVRRITGIANKTTNSHCCVQIIKTKPKRKQVLACGNHAWLQLYVNKSEFNCVWNGMSNRNSGSGSKIHFLRPLLLCGTLAFDWISICSTHIIDDSPSTSFWTRVSGWISGLGTAVAAVAIAQHNNEAETNVAHLFFNFARMAGVFVCCVRLKVKQMDLGYETAYHSLGTRFFFCTFSHLTERTLMLIWMHGRTNWWKTHNRIPHSPKLFTRCFGVAVVPIQKKKKLINQTHHHRRVFCHIYLVTHIISSWHITWHTRPSFEVNGMADGGERQQGRCAKICCWCGACVINDFAYAVLETGSTSADVPFLGLLKGCW